MMRDEVEILGRANAIEFLDLLRGDNAPDPAAFMARFTTVLERKINEDKTVTTGSTDLDKVERFFDWAFDVERAPAIPYTGDELAVFAEKARDTLLAESAECTREGDTSLAQTYCEDAADYHKIARLFMEGRVEEGREAHAHLDTAARHWLEGEGFEDRRYYA